MNPKTLSQHRFPDVDNDDGDADDVATHNGSRGSSVGSVASVASSLSSTHRVHAFRERQRAAGQLQQQAAEQKRQAAAQLTAQSLREHLAASVAQLREHLAASVAQQKETASAAATHQKEMALQRAALLKQMAAAGVGPGGKTVGAQQQQDAARAMREQHAAAMAVGRAALVQARLAAAQLPPEEIERQERARAQRQMDAELPPVLNPYSPSDDEAQALLRRLDKHLLAFARGSGNTKDFDKMSDADIVAELKANTVSYTQALACLHRLEKETNFNRPIHACASCGLMLIIHRGFRRTLRIPRSAIEAEVVAAAEDEAEDEEEEAEARTSTSDEPERLRTARRAERAAKRAKEPDLSALRQIVRDTRAAFTWDDRHAPAYRHDPFVVATCFCEKVQIVGPSGEAAPAMVEHRFTLYRLLVDPETQIFYLCSSCNSWLQRYNKWQRRVRDETAKTAARQEEAVARRRLHLQQTGGQPATADGLSAAAAAAATAAPAGVVVAESATTASTSAAAASGSVLQDGAAAAPAAPAAKAEDFVAKPRSKPRFSISSGFIITDAMRMMPKLSIVDHIAIAPYRPYMTIYQLRAMSLGGNSYTAQKGHFAFFVHSGPQTIGGIAHNALLSSPTRLWFQDKVTIKLVGPPKHAAQLAEYFRKRKIDALSVFRFCTSPVPAEFWEISVHLLPVLQWLRLFIDSRHPAYVDLSNLMIPSRDDLSAIEAELQRGENTESTSRAAAEAAIFDILGRYPFANGMYGNMRTEESVVSVPSVTSCEEASKSPVERFHEKEQLRAEQKRQKKNNIVGADTVPEPEEIRPMGIGDHYDDARGFNADPVGDRAVTVSVVVKNELDKPEDDREHVRATLEQLFGSCTDSVMMGRAVDVTTCKAFFAADPQNPHGHCQPADSNMARPFFDAKEAAAATAAAAAAAAGASLGAAAASSSSTTSATSATTLSSSPAGDAAAPTSSAAPTSHVGQQREDAVLAFRTGTEPANEYSREYFTYGWPEVFGNYVPHDKDEYLSRTFFRVAILHFSGVPAAHPFLLHFMANTMQRRATASAGSSLAHFRGDAGKQQIDKYVSKPWRDQLSAALASNDTARLKTMYQDMKRFFVTSAARVPFTQWQRQSSMSEMFSFYIYFSVPTFFVTIALDDANQVLTLRILKRMREAGKLDRLLHDDEFFHAAGAPADAAAGADGIPPLTGKEQEFGGELHCEIEVPLASSKTLVDLRRHRNNNVTRMPIVSAAVFYHHIDAFFEILLGCPRCKTASTMRKDSVGVLGIVDGWNRVIETQVRALLHAHALVYTRVKAAMMDRCIDKEAVRNALFTWMDSVVSTHIDPADAAAAKVAAQQYQWRGSLASSNVPGFTNPDGVQAGDLFSDETYCAAVDRESKALLAAAAAQAPQFTQKAPRPQPAAAAHRPAVFPVLPELRPRAFDNVVVWTQTPFHQREPKMAAIWNDVDFQSCRLYLDSIADFYVGNFSDTIIMECTAIALLHSHVDYLLGRNMTDTMLILPMNNNVTHADGDVMLANRFVGIVFAINHFVAFEYHRFSNEITFFDSHRGAFGTLSPGIYDSAISKLRAVRAIDRLHILRHSVDPRTPQQHPGSNDCMLHSISHVCRLLQLPQQLIRDIVHDREKDDSGRAVRHSYRDWFALFLFTLSPRGAVVADNDAGDSTDVVLTRLAQRLRGYLRLLQPLFDFTNATERAPVEAGPSGGGANNSRDDDNDDDNALGVSAAPLPPVVPTVVPSTSAAASASSSTSAHLLGIDESVTTSASSSAVVNAAKSSTRAAVSAAQKTSAQAPPPAPPPSSSPSSESPSSCVADDTSCGGNNCKCCGVALTSRESSASVVRDDASGPRWLCQTDASQPANIIWATCPCPFHRVSRLIPAFYQYHSHTFTCWKYVKKDHCRVCYGRMLTEATLFYELLPNEAHLERVQQQRNINKAVWLERVRQQRELKKKQKQEQEQQRGVVAPAAPVAVGAAAATAAAADGSAQPAAQQVPAAPAAVPPPAPPPAPAPKIDGRTMKRKLESQKHEPLEMDVLLIEALESSLDFDDEERLTRDDAALSRRRLAIRSAILGKALAQANIGYDNFGRRVDGRIVALLTKRLKGDEMVVAYNPTVSRAFACNHNFDFIGFTAIAQALKKYIASYMCKEEFTLEEFMSMVRDMLWKGVTKKSTAEDRDTVQRQTNFAFQVMINGVQKLVELCATVAGSIVLGYNAFQSSMPTEWLHGYSAVHTLRALFGEPEFLAPKQAAAGAKKTERTAAGQDMNAAMGLGGSDDSSDSDASFMAGESFIDPDTPVAECDVESQAREAGDGARGDFDLDSSNSDEGAVSSRLSSGGGGGAGALSDADDSSSDDSAPPPQREASVQTRLRPTPRPARASGTRHMRAESKSPRRNDPKRMHLRSRSGESVRSTATSRATADDDAPLSVAPLSSAASASSRAGSTSAAESSSSAASSDYDAAETRPLFHQPATSKNGMFAKLFRPTTRANRLRDVEGEEQDNPDYVFVSDDRGDDDLRGQAPGILIAYQTPADRLNAMRAVNGVAAVAPAAPALSAADSDDDDGAPPPAAAGGGGGGGGGDAAAAAEGPQHLRGSHITFGFFDAVVAYALRGKQLLGFSYYEFIGLCNWRNTKAARAPFPSGAIPFVEVFPQYDTRFITLRNVFCVPRWAGKVPEPVWRTDASRHQMNLFGELMGAVFFPWTYDNPPSVRCWSDLQRWMDDGRNFEAPEEARVPLPADPIDAEIDQRDQFASQTERNLARREWIRNMGSHESLHQVRSYVGAFRRKFATRRHGDAPKPAPMSKKQQQKANIVHGDAAPGQLCLGDPTDVAATVAMYQMVAPEECLGIVNDEVMARYLQIASGTLRAPDLDAQNFDGPAAAAAAAAGAEESSDSANSASTSASSSSGSAGSDSTSSATTTSSEHPSADGGSRATGESASDGASGSTSTSTVSLSTGNTAPPVADAGAAARARAQRVDIFRDCQQVAQWSCKRLTSELPGWVARSKTIGDVLAESQRAHALDYARASLNEHELNEYEFAHIAERAGDRDAVQLQLRADRFRATIAATLGAEQRVVFDGVLNRIVAQYGAMDQNAADQLVRPSTAPARRRLADYQRPFAFFVQGAPGTGKTHLFQRIVAVLLMLGFRPLVAAYAAAAAGLHDSGRTAHSLFGIEIGDDRRGELEKWEADSSRAVALRRGIECAGLLIIDEISMISSNFLACILQRISDTMGVRFGEPGFPNIVAVGDMYQIPPVGSGFTGALYTPVDGAVTSGTLCKMMFQAYFGAHKLSQQQRASHVQARSVQRLLSVRPLDPAPPKAPAAKARPGKRPPGKPAAPVTPLYAYAGPGEDPVTALSVIHEGFRIVSANDAADFAETAVVITARNDRRARFNFLLGREKAYACGSPFIMWRRPGAGKQQLDDAAYTNNPEMMGMFFFGARALLIKNICNTIKLSNGTSVIMHSVMWEDEPTHALWSHRILNTAPGVVIVVPPPDLVNVVFETSIDLREIFDQLQDQRRADTGLGTRLLHVGDLRQTTCDSICRLQPQRAGPMYRYIVPVKTELKAADGGLPAYMRHIVDLAYAITCHKSQGATIPRALVDLNFATEREAEMAKIYVALTRFRSADDVRLLPLTEHAEALLRKVAWPHALIVFMERMNVSGINPNDVSDVSTGYRRGAANGVQPLDQLVQQFPVIPQAARQAQAATAAAPVIRIVGPATEPQAPKVRPKPKPKQK